MRDEIRSWMDDDVREALRALSDERRDEALPEHVRQAVRARLEASVAGIPLGVAAIRPEFASVPAPGSAGAAPAGPAPAGSPAAGPAATVPPVSGPALASLGSGAALGVGSVKALLGGALLVGSALLAGSLALWTWGAPTSRSEGPTESLGSTFAPAPSSSAAPTATLTVSPAHSPGPHALAPTPAATLISREAEAAAVAPEAQAGSEDSANRTGLNSRTTLESSARRLRAPKAGRGALSPNPDLNYELTLLQLARAALAERPGFARELLRNYDKRFPQGVMRREYEILTRRLDENDPAKQVEQETIGAKSPKAPAPLQ